MEQKKGRRCLRLSRFKVGGSFSSESQRGAACPSVMIGFRFPRLLRLDGPKLSNSPSAATLGVFRASLFSSAAPPSPPGAGPFIRLLSGQKRKPATVAEPFSVHHDLTGYQGDLNDVVHWTAIEKERGTRGRLTCCRQG